MITVMESYPAGNGRYVEMVGLSTDAKPTENISNGSVFIEMNTGKGFFFNEAGSAWVEV